MSSESNGSLSRCLGYCAAATFIVASASQNALHGYELGARTSETTALIFASASVAGAFMAPIALAASFSAFRRWQLIRGIVAVALAAMCFGYAVVSSLGFVSGARDVAAATRSAEADSYAMAKAKAATANAELKTLADLPRGNRKIEKERADRKAKLERDRDAADHVMSAGNKATVADPTASAISSYAGALGYEIEPAKLSPWLVLLSVVFFELGAAASLIVVGALPSTAREEKPKAAAAVTPEKAPLTMADAHEASRLEKKTAGRKRSRALDDVLGKIEGAGGELEGTLDELGERLGLSKSSAHRALHALAGLGAVSLATSAAGTLVQMRGV